jgi:XTP/dITP diphosphohydrolase
MDLTFVSTNAGKSREVRTVLAEYGVKVHWARRTLPEVQADRLESVVQAKLAGARAVGPRVLVEDSGLFIPSLGGFPGVYSSYVLETIGLEGILRLLSQRNRHAVFRTVAGLSIGSRRWTCAGECRGRIAEKPRGSHGFGFDPIFIAEGDSRTFAQLDSAEKNRRSHRGKALRSVGRLLRSLE